MELDYTKLQQIVNLWKIQKEARKLGDVAIATVILKFIDQTNGGNSAEDHNSFRERLATDLKERQEIARRELYTDGVEYFREIYESYLLGDSPSSPYIISEDEVDNLISRIDGKLVKNILDYLQKTINIRYTNYNDIKYQEIIEKEIDRRVRLTNSRSTTT